jgi:hypothetical protein
MRFLIPPPLGGVIRNDNFVSGIRKKEAKHPCVLPPSSPVTPFSCVIPSVSEESLCLLLIHVMIKFTDKP